jgi:dipeptidyl aminopeptidase/acylaminoacyl peptidase
VRAFSAAAAAGVSALVLAGAAHASFPASQGRLLLISEDQGFAAPTLIRGDDNVLVGAPVGVNGTAAISPDGTQIAMVDTVPFFPGLPPPVLIVGSLLGEFDVLPVSSVGGRPTWSPDGSRIAYASSTSGNWDIYVSDNSGSAPVDVTASSPAADTEPRWSPDGTKIAFDSNRGGDVDVYSMNPDGSGVTNLTASPAQDTLGDWSPDSQRIVFSSTRSGGGDLYVMGRSGSPVTRLTSDPGADTHAAWSPDGTTIAFSNNSDGDDEVYRIGPDGSGLLKVTNNATEDLVQDWQALRDTSAPKVHALKSTGRRGGTGRFRFTVQEDSRTASIDLEYSYRTKHGSSFGEGTETLRDLRAGHVYAIPFRAKELAGAPKVFRFCVTATDPSANASNRSCARVTLLPPKKKKKR